MKTWEETIKYIRTQPEYKDLVEKAYFEEDLVLNVERFRNGTEFLETLNLINKIKGKAKSILDVGCGNGISCVSFALKGYDVTAVEPDPSNTIGAGAIRKLIEHYKLKNIAVYESNAEDIGFKDASFDIVYVRQAMHHAKDLDKFIFECARVLKNRGLLLTVRDHVIFDEEDKMQFLETHPLQKFYGGENAFTSQQYQNAMTKAGLKIRKVMKAFDSEINYFPLTRANIAKSKVKKKIGTFISNVFPFAVSNEFKSEISDLLNEKVHFGRMYSYLAVKA